MIIRRIASVFISGLALALAISAPAQTIRYVHGSGADAGDCADSSNPCLTVSYALDQASSGDTIDIAAGPYTEPNGIEIDKSVALRGAGRELPAGTALQAHTSPGQASSRVITMDGDYEVEISDLMIRHGVTDTSGGGIENVGATLTITNVAFVDNEAGEFSVGGGIESFASALQLSNVAFTGNKAGIGGAMYNNFGSDAHLENVTFTDNVANIKGGGIGNSESSPILTGVVFEGNEALGEDPGDGGGGMYNYDSSPELVSVDFISNDASGAGGGGILNTESSAPTLTNVTFLGNLADSSGGGMRNIEGSTPQLESVNFEGNVADSSGGGVFNSESSPSLSDVSFDGNSSLGEGTPDGGGGMSNWNGSSPDLTNVDFSENEANRAGGGVLNRGDSSPELVNARFFSNGAGTVGGGIANVDGSSPELLNATFWGNAVANLGGGIYNDDNESPAPTVRNTILWGNTAGGDGDEIYNTVNGSIWLTHSLVDGVGSAIVPGGDYSCHECLSDDPRFKDPGNGDLHLKEDSPAIDAGDPDTDLGLFPGGSGDPEDLDGNPRVFGGDIDMGTYEWLPLADAVFQDRFEN